MLRHTLIFTFNDGISDEVKTEAVERLRGLSETPHASYFSVGVNEATSANAGDLIEIAEFADQAMYAEYRDSPEHREFSAFIGNIATWKLVDDTFDSERHRFAVALGTLRTMQGEIVPVHNQEMVPVEWVLDVVNKALGIE